MAYQGYDKERADIQREVIENVYDDLPEEEQTVVDWLAGQVRSACIYIAEKEGKKRPQIGEKTSREFLGAILMGLERQGIDPRKEIRRP